MLTASPVSVRRRGRTGPHREAHRNRLAAPNIKLQAIGPTQTLSQMLATAILMRYTRPAHPARSRAATVAMRRLFENYAEIERAYWRDTGIFPIMHVIVMRREDLRSQPLDCAIADQGVLRRAENGLRRSRRDRSAEVDAALAGGTCREGAARWVLTVALRSWNQTARRLRRLPVITSNRGCRKDSLGLDELLRLNRWKRSRSRDLAQSALANAPREQRLWALASQPTKR